MACIVISSDIEAASSNLSIRAIVKQTGVNHCGRSQGITMPNGVAQAELIAQVYSAAGLNPADTPYVEAHGTGTERGDSIEARSIAKAFLVGDRSAERPLYVGAVKSNFGHSEAASGVVSVIKCVTMLENRVILPNANFLEPNAALDEFASKLVVCLLSSHACTQRRIAGHSSSRSPDSSSGSALASWLTTSGEHQ